MGLEVVRTSGLEYCTILGRAVVAVHTGGLPTKKPESHYRFGREGVILAMWRQSSCALLALYT